MLTSIQRIGLASKLPVLLKQQQDAKGIQRLSVGTQIAQIMKQLGMTGSVPDVPETPPAQQLPATDTTETTPAPANPDQAPAEAAPQPVPEAPDIVTEFLAGAYKTAKPADLVATLKGIAQYVGQFLTLDQAKEQCEAWYTAGGYTL